MDEGWVRIWRKITENPMWVEDTFTRGQAWVDILILANHKTNKFTCRGEEVVVERGQVGWSQSKLSKRWRWSRGKVNKFLKDLEDEGAIRIEDRGVANVVVVLNYDSYQKSEDKKQMESIVKKTEVVVGGEKVEEPTTKNKVGILKSDGEYMTPSDVIDRWNKIAKECGLKTTRQTNKKVKTSIGARMKEISTLDEWNAMFKAVKKRAKNYAQESWFGLDYVVRNDETFDKVVDDFMAWKYDGENKNGKFNDNIDVQAEIDEWEGFGDEE